MRELMQRSGAGVWIQQNFDDDTDDDVEEKRIPSNRSCSS